MTDFVTRVNPALTTRRVVKTVEGIPPEAVERGSLVNARLHGKYHGLRRTSDDSLVEGWYFVIREGDEAAEAALLAYADACEGHAPELAADLRQTVRDWKLTDGLYAAGWER